MLKNNTKVGYLNYYKKQELNSIISSETGFFKRTTGLHGNYKNLGGHDVNNLKLTLNQGSQTFFQFAFFKEITKAIALSNMIISS